MSSGPARGAIVMAAYSPDPELFRRQLLSLQSQTVSDWTCIVSVDGDRQPVEALVRRIVGADERFRIIGDGSRRGFYLNFEQGLAAVGEDATWIALADQDDEWYPEKLATLLPHLADVTMVSGQARLVTYPAGMMLGTTDRVDRGPDLTLLMNQFTGSLSVFSRELLETALPFPRTPSQVATHDHWLAVASAAHNGTRIIDTVVQDYVQHDSNVYGDPSKAGATGILAPVRNALRLADRAEGAHSPAAVARMTFWTYVGWRQLMVDTLRDRTARPDPMAMRIDACFGHHRRWRAMNSLLSSSVGAGAITGRYAWGYRASWFAGMLIDGRRRAAALMTSRA